MPGSAALLSDPGRHSPGATGALAVFQAEREQLTFLLRGLAARLDELDRRLSDLAWRRRGQSPVPGIGTLRCERSAMEADRARLTARLTVLARQLNELDGRLSHFTTHEHWPAARVGTCPECGYPSIASGLCACCRRGTDQAGPIRSES